MASITRRATVKAVAVFEALGWARAEMEEPSEFADPVTTALPDNLFRIKPDSNHEVAANAAHRTNEYWVRRDGSDHVIAKMTPDDLENDKWSPPRG